MTLSLSSFWDLENWTDILGFEEVLLRVPDHDIQSLPFVPRLFAGGLPAEHLNEIVDPEDVWSLHMVGPVHCDLNYYSGSTYILLLLGSKLTTDLTVQESLQL